MRTMTNVLVKNKLLNFIIIIIIIVKESVRIVKEIVVA